MATKTQDKDKKALTLSPLVACMVRGDNRAARALAKAEDTPESRDILQRTGYDQAALIAALCVLAIQLVAVTLVFF